MITHSAQFDSCHVATQSWVAWTGPQGDGNEPGENVILSSYLEGARQLEMLVCSIDQSSIFEALLRSWHSERGASSSLTKIVLSPAYQKIIGMGPKAVAPILKHLAAEKDHPDHWFWALQCITGVNPVPAEHEGNLPKMSKAWLEWAKSEGYVW